MVNNRSSQKFCLVKHGQWTFWEAQDKPFGDYTQFFLLQTIQFESVLPHSCISLICPKIYIKVLLEIDIDIAMLTPFMANLSMMALVIMSKFLSSMHMEGSKLHYGTSLFYNIFKFGV